MKRKLATSDVELMLTLFQKGWRQAHLRRKFCIDHSTVHYYVRKYKVIRNGDIFRLPPIEIQHTYDINVNSRMFPKPKCYADYVREDREREAKRKELEKLGIVDSRYNHPPQDMVKWSSGLRGLIN